MSQVNEKFGFFVPTFRDHEQKHCRVFSGRSSEPEIGLECPGRTKCTFAHHSSTLLFFCECESLSGFY